MARALSFAGTVGVIGAVAFYRFIGRLTPGDEGAAATEQARRVGLWAAAIVLAIVPIRLAMQAKSLVFEGDPWLPMIPRVISTQWGHAAVWQGAAAIIATVAFLRLRGGAQQHWTQARVAGLVLAIVPAFMGHATAVEQWRWAAIGSDVVHVVAAGAWTGALSVLTLCALGMRNDPNGGFVLAGFVDRFSSLAKRSVTALVATGVISALLHLRAFSDLTTTDYGTVLLSKLGLVFIALLLGYGHSITAGGQLRISGVRRVLPTFLLEWGVLVAVLLVTGLLAGSPPPGTE